MVAFGFGSMLSCWRYHERQALKTRFNVKNPERTAGEIFMDFRMAAKPT